MLQEASISDTPQGFGNKEAHLLHMSRGTVDLEGTGVVQAGNGGPDLTKTHSQESHGHELLLLHQSCQDASPDSGSLWQGRFELLEFDEMLDGEISCYTHTHTHAHTRTHTTLNISHGGVGVGVLTDVVPHLSHSIWLDLVLVALLELMLLDS